MNHTLESSRIFKYAAWVAVVCFALGTGALALELNKNMENLERLEDTRMNAGGVSIEP